MMKLQKARTAAIAVSVATAIALSGTFAWQSVSQKVRNEATRPTNPGGRLHDDFSGYDPDDTKDIYVENFGKQPIYARVRLDEYMEIGEGAGLKGTVGAPNPDNHATPLVTGAKLDDETTWTTHIPGATSAETGVGAETGFTDPSKTFHTYWTWTMGGQAADNPDGKTVYMPTFNKNKDSLMGDVNGTLAGIDMDPAAGDQYDDYVQYTGGDTASRVRDADTATYPDGAAYDADDNTTDECGPYGGAGGTGVAGTNYEMEPETHTAQETMHATVITMAEYKAKTDAQKAEFLGWVYDVDGWAYWSQPIEPGTPTATDAYITNATGVLLDRIVLEHEPSETWYYSINAVGQFITADDLGRSDDPQTGFYAEGEPPTDDALDLLEGIGVNTAAVKGSITPSASVTVDGTVNHLNYVVQRMNIDLSAVVAVTGEASPDQNVTWTVLGNTDASTQIVTTGGTPVLQVGANEDGPLTLVATSTAYDRLKGKLKLPVHPLTYTVTVTPDGNATSVLPGATQGFTAKLTSNDFQTGLPQTFNWALDTTGVTYKAGTKVDANATDSSKATLTVDRNETVDNIKLIVTPTDTTTYAGVKGEATIAVPDVAYTVDIKDSATTPASVKDTTVEVGIGKSADFTVDVKSTPTGATITDNWTWASSDTSKATVSGTGATASVAIPDGVAIGETATITATNSDYTPALTASFTVKVKDKWDTRIVDGVEYIVLLKNVTVNGKAAGETVATNHQADLLLAREVQSMTAFDASSNNWKDSDVREYLNSTASGKWLDGKTQTQAKAITVTLQTQQSINSMTFDTTEDTVFLLSSADVCGKRRPTGGYEDAATEEYTYNGTRLPCFKEGDSADLDRIATDSSGTEQQWWLRSPAYDSRSVACIINGGGVSAYDYNASYGVRPAFWYNLDT